MTSSDLRIMEMLNCLSDMIIHAVWIINICVLILFGGRWWSLLALVGLTYAMVCMYVHGRAIHVTYTKAQKDARQEQTN